MKDKYILAIVMTMIISSTCVYAQTTRQTDLPAETFALIQEKFPFPTDFYTKRIMYSHGMLTHLENIQDVYWKQPEWDPMFEKTGVELIKHPSWENATKPRFAAIGMRVTPINWGYRTNSNRVVAYFYISSDWLISTYQGLILKPINPPAEITFTQGQFSDGTKEVIQNPELVKKYFSVKIAVQDCDACEKTDGTFILEPSYPQFMEGYKKRVEVTIDISPDTPTGKYAIPISGFTPTQDENENYYMKYGLAYSPNQWNVGNTYYMVFIEYEKPNTSILKTNQTQILGISALAIIASIFLVGNHMRKKKR